MKENSSDSLPLTNKQAFIDLGYVLVPLFVLKEWLLRVDGMWTYAGPISLICALLIAYWRLRVRGQYFSDIGLARPRRIYIVVLLTILTFGVGIAFGEAGNYFIEFLQTTFNLPPAVEGERFSNRFADLPGNLLVYLYWLVLAWVIGGFVEETLFRGFLLTRFAALMKGAIPFSLLAGAILQAVIFGQQHIYYQGWQGFVATGLAGLLYGVLYIVFKRNLWPMMISHGATNTLGLTLMYLGLL